MKLDQLHQLTGSLQKWRRSVLNKEIDLNDVARSLKENLELVASKYQAFITILPEKEILSQIRKGINSRKPLLGWPFTMKDIFVTKNIKTTAGANLLSEYKPPYSSTVYKRLLVGGGSLLAKTNCDAWGFGASTENSDFYPSRNPYDPSRVPGGSSGGAAVAVATGVSGFDIAEDTGGSIRQPAALTGVTGFKPTYGSISRYGAIAFSSSLDTVGIIGRRADDIAKIFNLIKGIDNLDATVRPNQSETEILSAGELKKLTIGYLPQITRSNLQKEIYQTNQKAEDFFKKTLKISFKEIKLPHFNYGVATYYVLAPAEASSNLSRYDGNRFGKKRNSFGSEAIRRIILGNFALASGYYDAYYIQALKVRRLIFEDFIQAFKEVDLILMPTTPTTAFKIGERTDPLQLYLQDIFTIPASLAGIPGVSFLADKDKNGLPIGLQLIGPHFQESLLLSLVAYWQSEEKTNFVYPEIK